MSKISIENNTVIRFFTTPEKLRELADKMEKQWDNSKPSDSMVIEEFNNENCNFKIVIDQETLNNFDCLSIKAIKKYLLNNGWKSDYRTEKEVIYKKYLEDDEDSFVKLGLPVNNNLKFDKDRGYYDHLLRDYIKTALKRIEQVENRTIYDIALDIKDFVK